MTKLIASLTIAAALFAGIASANAGAFDAKDSYLAPGGLYSPVDGR